MSDLSGAVRTAHILWKRDMLRFLRDRSRLASSIGMPILFLLLFGGGFSPAITGLAEGRVDYVQFLFSGILAMTVLFTAVYSAVSVVWDRQFGFLKEVLVAPVSRTAVALGKVAGGTTLAIMQGLIVLLLAPFLRIPFGFDQVLSLFTLLLVMAFMMTSLGLLLAVRERSMEGFHMVMNFLLLPMFFLSGAFFPLQGIPAWMRLLAAVDPVTYGVDALRWVTLADLVPYSNLRGITLHALWVNVVVMLAFSAAFLIPSIALFRKTE